MYNDSEETLHRVEAVLKSGHMTMDLLPQDLTELLASLSSYYDELNRQNDALRRVIHENAILKAKYQQLYEDAPAGYVIFRQDGQIIDVNKTFCKMMALSEENALASAITDFFQPAQQQLLQKTCERLIQNGQQVSLELSLSLKNGPSDVLMLIDRFQPLKPNGQTDSANDNYLLRSVVNDISALKHHQREIWQKSIHDPLTGVYNRLFYTEQLPHLAKAQYLPLSVIVLDIDRLKIINDTLGHSFGDEAIATIAQILQKNARPTDYICRTGGDELVVLLPNTDGSSAQAYAQHCCQEIAQHTLSGISLSFSWGAATRSSIHDALDMVIATAEDMMYTRKLEHSAIQQNSAIRAIIHSLYKRSPRLYQHCSHVAKLGKQFGNWLGLDTSECTFLWRLGIVHDIGMASLADEILTKTVPLTDANLHEIRRHPEIGARILRQNLRSSDMAQIVLYHHENWRGGDYPTGCISPNLPFESRLLRIFDTYDCILHGLAGDAPLDTKDTIKKLRDEAGSSLDPNLTESFITFLNQQALTEEAGLIGTQTDTCALQQDFLEALDFDRL